MFEYFKRKFSHRPLVSVCMTLKNGMPFLKDSLDSIFNQTYQNIELIIQDCCSMDGSLDLITKFAQKTSFPVSVISEPDRGIADALNKAWSRVNGDIICLADSDNFYMPDHIEKGVDFLRKRSNVAIAYTGQKIVDADGTFLYDWMPSDFSFEKVMNLELVPPSGSIFIKRNLLGLDLRYDISPELGHVPDIEFWTRIGYKKYSVSRIDCYSYCTRMSEASGSCQIFRYDEFVESKIFAMKRIFKNFDLTDYKDLSLEKSLVGIYSWAAWHVYSSQGCSEMFKGYMTKAHELNQFSEPYSQICKRSNYYLK